MPFEADHVARRVLASQRLRSLLGQFAEPCDADFTTPLIGREYSADKDAGRAVCLRSLLEAVDLGTLLESLRTVEQGKLSKVGSFSKGPGYSQPNHQGVSLEDKVMRYFSPRDFRIRSWSAVQYANDFVSACYDVRTLGKLTPLPLEDSVFLFNRTGLGFPDFTSDPDYLESYYRLSALIRSSGYSHDYAEANPSVLGTRGDSSGPYLPAKKRAVFQRSRVDGNLEKCIQHVALNALRTNDKFAAWRGRRYVDIAVTRFMTRDRGMVLSLDFSNFDATVPFEVLDMVFKILENWFVREAGPLIRFCKESFKRSSIFTPSGLIYKPRTGGIPSGSVLTNLIGSLVNLWVMSYAAHCCGVGIVDALVQGDDGLYRFTGRVNLERLSECLFSDFGMVMSTDPSKSLYSRNVVHYLQMVHSRDYIRGGLYVGVRPVVHVLNHAMSREHQRVSGWENAYHSVRWLQQWEDADEHPSFREFCQWLKNHDPYLEEVLLRLLSEDVDFLRAAQAALSSGGDSWARIPVKSLLRSSVVSQVCKLPGFETLERRRTKVI